MMPRERMHRRSDLWWCVNCNLPVIEDRTCCKCMGSTDKVLVNPRGDLHPAWGKKLTLIQETIDRRFGQGVGKRLVPSDKLVIVNNVPFIDYMEEIIVDGQNLGKILFDITSLDWFFLPSLEGARRLQDIGSGKWITVYKTAVDSILKGANVFSVGVCDADKEIAAGDYVYVISPSNEVICVGRARMTGQKMVQRIRKMAVKSIASGAPSKTTILNGGQLWEDAIRANAQILEEYEQEAISFIKQVAHEYAKPVTVAFSGGKDSLCTLLLVSKSLNAFYVNFIDTGIEFPETVSYVHQVIRALNLTDFFLTENVDDVFWKQMEKFGPPGKDYRWCCKVCKLGPTSKLLTKRFPSGCLSFLGNRIYESSRRYHESRVAASPWMGNQVAAYPIQQWGALAVWLYVLKEKVPINPLYFEGHERIGCWLCPASNMSEFRRLETSHSNLMNKWTHELERWRHRLDFSKEWIKYGFWRWRRMPPAQIELAKRFDTNLPSVRETKVGKMEFSIEVRTSRCCLEDAVVKGRFNVSIDTGRATNILNAYGPAKLSTNLGMAHLRINKQTVCIFENGDFTVRGAETLEENVKTAYKVAYAIILAQQCTGCGICVSHCQMDAIRLIDSRAWLNPEKCRHCGLCLDWCPLLRLLYDRKKDSTAIAEVRSRIYK